MYGRIGKIIAAAGRRDELIEAVLSASGELPGCLSYVVARDPAEANAVWVTEVWTNEQMHRESLTLHAVKDAIGRAKPWIESMGPITITEPVGGQGLAHEGKGE